MSKVLVTGGCGYIGSHTLVDLINHGFEVISADNNSRSDISILKGIHEITNVTVKNYNIDLCDLNATEAVFEDNDIDSVIHFAAFKSVNESVKNPIAYYHNNLESLVNVLKCLHKYQVLNFVFSSSCSVYGNSAELPVTESAGLQEAASPYGYTKQIGEKMIYDFSQHSEVQSVLLRYFNPVGAHDSAKIGEVPFDVPENLVPIITQTAIGKIPELVVHGNDYDTDDGTCIRDYIHIMDIANAHTKAMQYLKNQKNQSNYEIFNLGTGKGVSVLEAITVFEKVSGIKLNYKIGPRRDGDVVSVYANNDKAIQYLNWQPKRSVEDMMASAWKWEQRL